MAKLTESSQFQELLELGRKEGFLTTEDIQRIMPGSLDQEKQEKLAEYLRDKHQIDVVETPANGRSLFRL